MVAAAQQDLGRRHDLIAIRHELNLGTDVTPERYPSR